MADAPMMMWIYHLLKWGTRNNPPPSPCPGKGAGEADIEVAAETPAAATAAGRAEDIAMAGVFTPLSRPRGVLRAASQGKRAAR